MNATPNNNHSPLNAFAAQAAGALTPPPRFTTTPTSRNGDGYHRTDKPTSSDGQWVMVPGGKLPPRAFEMHEGERKRFYKLAHALPLNDNPMAAAAKHGETFFDATWAAEHAKFTAEIAAGELEVLRLAADRDKLAADLEQVHATVETELEPQMPARGSLKWWAFGVCGLCFCLSSAGAISNIVCRVLPETQAFWPALAVAVVWVMFAVAAKIAMRAVRSPIREVLHWSIAAVGLGGALLWLAGLVTGYATEINLDNLTSASVLAPSKVAPFVGQLLAEFAVGYACLCGLLGLVQHPRGMTLNPNRQALSECLAELNGEAAKIQMQLANPHGNLAEYKASREAFIAEGLGIVRLRMEEATSLEELQRRHVENQRRLHEFTT